MREVLARWNSAEREEAVREIMSCCGSTAWAGKMAGRRPFSEERTLLVASDRVWFGLPEADWLEAFRSHPRIGERPIVASAAPRSAEWSNHEQSHAAGAEDQIKLALSEGNRAYEQKFGHIFIVCAMGKSAPEILEILRRRMHNEGGAELREAAEQQRQITQLRLKKWLGV
jgi:2-oxo-4-hydroxy-4-carboxy-5-ureidoimidazoline decarboxylase